MNIPDQYTMGFKPKVIPVEERAYGKFAGQTIVLNGGSDIMGVFEGTCRTSDGLIFYFSTRVTYSPKGVCRAEKPKKGLSSVVTTNQPVVKTVPEGLDTYIKNHNAAVEKDKDLTPDKH